MSRVCVLEQKNQAMGRFPGIELSIDDLVEETDLAELRVAGRLFFPLQDQAIQKLVAGIRTDLDSFSLDEICSLVRHGYEVGLKRFLREQLLPSGFEPSDPCVKHFPAVYWPDEPALLDHIKSIRQLLNLRPYLKAAGESSEEIGKIAAAYLERVNPQDADALATQMRRAEDAGRAAEIAKLRERLKRAAVRRFGLWNYRDWCSWLLLALALGTVSAIGAVILRTLHVIS